ncbi:MAG: hypothetical protein Q9169_006398 [Polycauliona sp. 2 TL-2023]
MGRPHRPLILENCLDNRIITFPGNKSWQLTTKISGKRWDGCEPLRRARQEDWQPSEEHAVYECAQTKGPNTSTEAIMKIRLEVPYVLPPSDNPKERAKEASGMRLNGATTCEIETLKGLTAAGCSVTPSLLGIKMEVQDKSILAFKSTGDDDYWVYDRDWWLPGGYIVYILMTKLPAQPLQYRTFWDDSIFNRQERDDVRAAFKRSYL